MAGQCCVSSASLHKCRGHVIARLPHPSSKTSEKLSATVAEVQAAHPHNTVEVWSQDEARLGLFAIVRRVWAPRGKRPIAMVQPKNWVLLNFRAMANQLDIWYASWFLYTCLKSNYSRS